jgi:aspartate racemase
MNTVGIVGGIGPESTIEYYRKIVAAYCERDDHGNYPQIIINSINMKEMLDLIGAGEFDKVADRLISELDKLASAGADFGLLASNTPHIVFDKVREYSSLPLISIVEATCNKAKSMGLRRVAVFGTKFTMQGGFYDQVFSQHDISVFTPDDEDQCYIHDKYMGELIKGVIRDETKSELLAIAAKMKLKHDVQGLVLGGTELSLILQNNDVPSIHVLDTTEIHVESILEALSTGAGANR